MFEAGKIAEHWQESSREYEESLALDQVCFLLLFFFAQGNMRSRWRLIRFVFYCNIHTYKSFSLDQVCFLTAIYVYMLKSRWRLISFLFFGVNV